MNLTFAVYETLRRVLLLGVGVAVLGLALAPEEEPPQVAEAEPAPAETAAIDRVPQRSVI